VPLTLNIGDEPPETITLIDEDFNFGMPSSWEIVDGGNNDDADPSVWTWTDQNPCSGGLNTHRHIDPPVSEPFMIVDSDCAGPDAILDEQLKLPIMDFTMADSAFLEFDQHFAMISDLQGCYVDIMSSLTQDEWINIWEQHGESPDFPPIGGHITITDDFSLYAVGASNVQLRFRYYDAEYGWWWVIDNVKVYYSPSTSCTMDRCCPSMTTPQLTITDDDLCAQTGITIEFTSSTPSTRHDFFVDGNPVQSDVTSPIHYNPNNSSEHSYKIKAINYYEDCYIESSESKFTDNAETPPKPSPPTVQDLYPCETSTIAISWSSVQYATNYDLLVDSVTTVQNVTSPYTYNPGNTDSHTYQIRGRNVINESVTCTGDWSNTTSFADGNEKPATPTSAPTVSDVSACATSGVSISWGTLDKATAYDLRVDSSDSKIVSNVTSPYTYSPGDNNSHTYQIRGKNGTCTGDWGPTASGSDINDTPGAPSITAITDLDPCVTSGITITYTVGTGATSHDLYKDGSIAVSGYSSGATYQPGDTTSHSYKIRAKKNTCYTDSTPVSGTDVNDKPGAPTITGITDVSACATTGIKVAYTAGSGATSHDLYKDGSIAVSGYSSGATYQPGDNNSHSYVIRAKKNTCYTDSTAVSGTDVNDTPGQPAITSITDNDACATSGITINYTAGSGATSHDLYKDGGLAVTSYVSGATYQPGDTSSHTYVIRARKATCYNDSTGVSGTDTNNTPGVPVITSIIDNDPCATSGITINYTAGSGALVHDLWKDGALAQANFASGSTYTPGDNASHTYVIRGKRATCYTDSTGVAGTDANILPSVPTITSVADKDPCSLSGVTISWGAVEFATSYDIAVDSTGNVVGNTSSLSYDYSPGNSNSHNYYVRAKNSSCTGSWSSAVSGNDVDDTPGQPSITDIADIDGCQTNGITITYTSGSGATSHDLYKDGGLAQSNFVSGATYQPGDTSSHTYVIRARKATCYNDSTGVSGTDTNNTPGVPVITSIIDNDPCATSGITINYTAGSGALVHDLWKDGALAQANFASGSTYTPGDNASHTYVIRGKRATCYTDSTGVAGTDANILPSVPTITSVADKDPCSLSGVTISWGAVEFATSYDIAVDSTGNVVGNTSSLSYDYSPGNSNSHNYYVRAKNASCTGSWSSPFAGIDGVSTIGGTTITSVVDKDNCALSGVTISWGAVSGATSYDIAFDSTSNIVGNTSLTSYDYSPGDKSTHNYYVRGKDANSCPGAWSSAYSGTDINNKPGQPIITSITDNDGCSLSGIRIYYTAGSGGIVHDLYKDGLIAISNYSSGSSYSPGDSSTHTYVIRAKRSICYTDSEGYVGTDMNGTPSAISLNATNYDGSCGIKIEFTGGIGAAQFDLWVNGNQEVQNITSGYIYQPGDSTSRNYMIRGINGGCYVDSDVDSVSDPNCGVPPGEVGNGTNFTWTANQSSQTFSWTAEPTASGYRIYRGTKTNLADLCNTNSDFCTRADQTGTSLNITSDSPQTADPTNKIFFYLITGYNAGGEGTAGSTSSCGTRQINSTGNCS
jgi:hypothetical protein